MSINQINLMMMSLIRSKVGLYILFISHRLFKALENNKRGVGFRLEFI